MLSKKKSSSNGTKWMVLHLQKNQSQHTPQATEKGY